MVFTVYPPVSDVTNARSIGQLPEGAGDLCNACHSAKKLVTEICAGEDGVAKEINNHRVSLDNVWTLLEQAKREETSSDAVFIHECVIHPYLFVVLANNRQLQQIGQFCTNPKEFCVFGVNPTFNIFHKNISLTVTTYQHLRLVSSITGRPPDFIGPLLMHQHKDWKTYWKFSHTSTKTGRYISLGY